MAAVVCKLCAAPNGKLKRRFTAEWCENCHERVCERHIIRDTDAQRWLCKKCARKILKRTA